jgi:2-keto-4-pentenoate hydratase/2-oxohepta-3-ene-1,7-dioic acid hydratase in catechol pathway
MKLYTFIENGRECLGAEVADGRLVDLKAARSGRGEGALVAFENMQSLIEAGEAGLDAARRIIADPPAEALRTKESVQIAPPLRPRKIWSFSIFAEHLRSAGIGARKMLAAEAPPEVRKMLGGDEGAAPMPPPGYFKIPPYYFPDVMTITGQDSTVKWPSYSNWIDYELELAAVIGKAGKDIKVEDAQAHIFGYTILNDLSARDAQIASMAVAGTPGKGKDFDNSNPLGPCIITADEMPDPFALTFRVRVNGEEWAAGVPGVPDWPYDACINHATQSQTIYAGELFSSGCVKGCCATELARKLSRGDKLELEVDGLGVLRTHIV